MTYDDAVRDATRLQADSPHLKVGVASKDNEVWEVVSGKTMGKFSSRWRKGYDVRFLFKIGVKND